MRIPRTIAVLFLAITSWAAIACTAGTGPLASFDDPYDRPPDSRDKPGDGRDDPTITGRDNPPGAIENPGSQGAGPSGGAKNCAPCDGVFSCSTASGGQTVTSTTLRKSNNGQCDIVNSKGKVEGSLLCGGQITGEGLSGATWTANGADGFTVTGTGQVNGQSVTLKTTCSRSTGTSKNPGTDTPAANPTGTVTKPTVPPIADAGTKG